MLHTKVIFHDDATRNQTATTDDVDIITLKVTMKATMKMMTTVLVAGRASLAGRTGTVNANQKETLNWQLSSDEGMIENRVDAMRIIFFFRHASVSSTYPCK